MLRTFTTLLILTVVFAGCGGTPPAKTEQIAPDGLDTALPEPNYEIPMRNFTPLTIGPYAVQPMFEEEIENGHYNIKVSGGEFNAVRFWVGTEEPGDVMVVKTELENDYQHGHLEVPSPLPADYALWIEIEDQEGKTHKGSTPLKQAG